MTGRIQPLVLALSIRIVYYDVRAPAHRPCMTVVQHPRPWVAISASFVRLWLAVSLVQRVLVCGTKWPAVG